MPLPYILQSSKSQSAQQEPPPGTGALTIEPIIWAWVGKLICTNPEHVGRQLGASIEAVPRLADAMAKTSR